MPLVVSGREQLADKRKMGCRIRPGRKMRGVCTGTPVQSTPRATCQGEVRQGRGVRPNLSPDGREIMPLTPSRSVPSPPMTPTASTPASCACATSSSQCPARSVTTSVTAMPRSAASLLTVARSLAPADSVLFTPCTISRMLCSLASRSEKALRFLNEFRWQPTQGVGTQSKG